jgi:hypothetical protein
MEAVLVAILAEKAENVIEKVNCRIKKEISEALLRMKTKLRETGRCGICTLILPCKHPQTLKTHPISSYKPPPKPSYWDIQARNQSLPRADLSTLEKIEDYREKIILKRIQQLNTSKDLEIQESLHQKITEDKRRKYALQQKAKLEKYKQDPKTRKKITSL